MGSNADRSCERGSLRAPHTVDRVRGDRVIHLTRAGGLARTRHAISQLVISRSRRPDRHASHTRRNGQVDRGRSNVEPTAEAPRPTIRLAGLLPVSVPLRTNPVTPRASPQSRRSPETVRTATITVCQPFGGAVALAGMDRLTAQGRGRWLSGMWFRHSPPLVNAPLDRAPRAGLLVTGASSAAPLRPSS